MTVRKLNTFWNYDHTRDGQIAVGTITSAWFDAAGILTVNLEGVFAGGTTQVFLDFSADAINVDSSSPNLAANLAAPGVDVSVARYTRVRIVQTGGSTTTAQLGASAAHTVLAVEKHN